MADRNPRIPVEILSVGLSADDTDVYRSLRRWYGMLLPAPWDIWYARNEVSQRPSGFVIPATPGTQTGSAFVRDNSRSFDAFLYPPGIEGNPFASRDEAEQIGAAIKRAWANGLYIGDAYYSRTMRLPVFDHEGVAWDSDVAPDAEPFDHLPVSDLSVNVTVDPDDDTLYTVAVSQRIDWTQDGDVSRLEGRLLQDVRYGRAGS